MFCFGREEFNYKSKRVANYRMDDFRHNPYIGSFHAVPYKTEEASQTDDQLLLMSEAKTNPMIGLFRHSPPMVYSHQSQNQRVGLKSVIYEETQPHSASLPIISRLRLNTSLPRSTLTGRTFLSSLRKLPVTVYCSPSPQTRPSSIASNSVIDGQHSSDQRTDDVEEDKPMCAICLEEYADGDELFTLACSHCFHSECVNRWFYHGCISSARYPYNTPSHTPTPSSSSNPAEHGHSNVAALEAFQEAFRCPACRQDHIALSEQGSVTEVSVCQSTLTRNTATAVSLIEVVEVRSNDGGIPMGSFFDLGQSLLLDGGYDFLSDVGSEKNSMSSSQPQLQSTKPPMIPMPKRLQTQSPILLSPLRNIKTIVRKSLEESIYSDCGFPLSSPQRTAATMDTKY